MLSFFTRSWNDSDWRVRERAAQRLKDRSKLLHLALSDISTEVRLAAVKSLSDEEDLAHVVRNGACEKSRGLALSRLTSIDRLLQLAAHTELAPELRCRAIHALPPDVPTDSFYSDRDPVPVKVALAGRMQTQPLLQRIAADETDRQLRCVAIGRLENEAACFALLEREADATVRTALHQRLRSPELLREALLDEDDPGARIALIERIHEEDCLRQIIATDPDLGARKTAIRQLKDSAPLVELASTLLEPDLALEALSRLSSDEHRAIVARQSPDESVRWEALRTIRQPDDLRALVDSPAAPEIRWLAARRLGELCVAELPRISSARMLRKAVEVETDPVVARWMIAHLNDSLALEALAQSSESHLSSPAAQRLREQIGPFGVRFAAIPDRPYELSSFVITVRQLRAGLPRLRLADTDEDLPATGITPEIAREFCTRMSDEGGITYRLPSFDEWFHACMADDEAWFERRGSDQPENGILESETVAIRRQGPRRLQQAWPNPWGLLDMLGNVACWIDGTTEFLINQPSVRQDPLAAGDDWSDPQAFAVAAGLHWGDQRIRRGRLERLVRRSFVNTDAAPKVGFRVLRETPLSQQKRLEYVLTLAPETAAGITAADVSERLHGRILGGRTQARNWYQVAPVVIARSTKYEEVHRLKMLVEGSGGRTRLTVQPATPR